MVEAGADQAGGVLVDGGEEQRFLVGEVGVGHGAAHAGVAGDVGHGGGAEPLASEAGDGGGQDRLAGVGALGGAGGIGGLVQRGLAHVTNVSFLST